MHVRAHTRHGGNDDLIDYDVLFVIATRAIDGRTAPRQRADAAMTSKLDGGKRCLHHLTAPYRRRLRVAYRENSVYGAHK